MNETQAVDVMSMFLAAYPSTAATDGTVELWVQALNSCSDEEGRQVAVDWIRTSKFFPTIAEFGELLNQSRRRVDLEQSGRPYRDRAPICTFEEGVTAAINGYLAECRLQGREPSLKILEGFQRGMVGGVKVERP